jgi:riboflavin kinase/FMN adenylyltransferase
MKVIYGITKFPLLKRSVIAIGVFDGVHIAHQKIIAHAVREAKKKKIKSAVITFWPHPQKVLLNKETLLLSSLQHRIKLISRFNPDYCLVINFTHDFSGMPLKAFVEKILIQRLGMKSIYIGADFRFGKKRRGSRHNLISTGKALGFKVHALKPIKARGKKVSSSLIRKLIHDLKFHEIRHYLGRDLSLYGRVIHGDKRGKLLGYPTANIQPQHEVIPPDGIYAVKIILDGKTYNGVGYIGTAPTFGLSKRIEVHIFNFNRRIYHKFVEIKFIGYIRPDKKFIDRRELIRQIKLDTVRAKRILATPSPRVN